MEYSYVIMWFAVGLILIFRMAKENKIFYLAGGYFIFLGTWCLLNMKLSTNMFRDLPGIVFKALSAIAFVILTIAFVKNYKKDSRKNSENRFE